MRLNAMPPFPHFSCTARSLALAAFWLASSVSLAQTPLTGIARIAGGSSHTCAVTTGGGVKCWGLNDNGQVGDNATAQRLTAVDVSGLASGASEVTGGFHSTCALTAAGGIKCWGYNGSGELGDNSITQRLTPANVVGIASGFSAVALGFSHACARSGSGGVQCWGYNSSKQLGNRNNTESHVPVDVLTAPASLLSGAGALAAGGYHNCVIAGGGIVCWGNNGYGQLGDGQSGITASEAVTVIAGPAMPAITSITAITAGTYHTCALNAAGGVQCWGRNDFGQLGTNQAITMSATPVDVFGLASGVSSISAGDRHTCARVGGTVKCWGWNFAGQLGDNSNTQSPTPVDVLGISTATAIAAGGFHTCALLATSGVKCWGYNLNGQLGDNSLNFSSVPVDVLTIPPIKLTAVQSRKLHDTAGTFDLALDRFAPIGGAVTVEPRITGALHAIVFQFDGQVTIPGTVSAVNGAGMAITTGSPTVVGGSAISVNLIGVANNSRATVSLSGVNGNISASASIGFLVGDVNSTRAVDAFDLIGVKARSGQSVDATNFRFDVNTTGAISASDILAVKARSGSALN